MDVTGVIGQKIQQKQGFLEDGTRVPLSVVSVGGTVVTQIKTTEKDGYSALQMGINSTRKADKPTLGHIKKAGLQKAPAFLKELRVEKDEDIAGIELGGTINVEEILEPGDIIDVVGMSKGKGFAGGVKRYGFKGGPKTHGQSDRHRAPGAIGQGTTPGRVYKGKRMAGNMGHEQVTVKNLMVLDIKDGVLYVKGLIPGFVGSYVTILKRGKNKKFMPLFKVEEPVTEEAPLEAQVKEEKVTEEVVEVPEVQAAPVVEEKVETTEEVVAAEATKDEEKEEAK